MPSKIKNKTKCTIFITVTLARDNIHTKSKYIPPRKSTENTDSDTTLKNKLKLLTPVYPLLHYL